MKADLSFFLYSVLLLQKDCVFKGIVEENP